MVWNFTLRKLYRHIINWSLSIKLFFKAETRQHRNFQPRTFHFFFQSISDESTPDGCTCCSITLENRGRNQCELAARLSQRAKKWKALILINKSLLAVWIHTEKGNLSHIMCRWCSDRTQLSSFRMEFFVNCAANTNPLSTNIHFKLFKIY